MNRIRSLDGIRAISIIMVIFGHAMGAGLLPDFIPNNGAFHLLFNSSLGVRIFFVISGFLITKLLIKEKEKTQTISLKKFYIKRAFRIFPVFYLYIICLIVLRFGFDVKVISDYFLLLIACFYLMNYRDLIHPNSSDIEGKWFTGHFWTLSLEEQFYLFWPISFKKIESEKLIKIVWIIVLLMPLIRVATYFLLPQTRGQIGGMLHTGSDAILIGCLGAFYEKKRLNHSCLKNYFVTAAVLLFLFVGSELLMEVFGGYYSLTLGMTLNNFCILYFIFWAIKIENGFTRFLNWKPWAWIGVLSYSIYVWQQLLLNDFLMFPWTKKINILLVLLVAAASYYLVEKPILKLRNKFI